MIRSALTSEGSVLIASSSGIEDAHESKALAGSYFTHYWNAALRGGGDRNEDGIVTLTEAYEYARTLTLRDTATQTGLPQRPSFRVRLHGRSDFPLSRLARGRSFLQVDKRHGALAVLELDTGLPAAEVPRGEHGMRRALAPGRYLVRTTHEDHARSIDVELVRGHEFEIADGGMSALLNLRNGVRWSGTDYPAFTGMLWLRAGITDRLQWDVGTLFFTYRFGTDKSFEVLATAGAALWDLVFGNALTGKLDARLWLWPGGSVTLSGAFSDFNVDEPKLVCNAGLSGCLEQPSIERSYRGAIGFTHAFSDRLSVSFGALYMNRAGDSRLFYARPFFVPGNSQNVGVFGSVFFHGTRTRPLLAYQVTSGLSLDLHAHAATTGGYEVMSGVSGLTDLSGVGRWFGSWRLP